jgi:hypothetical protein
MMARSLLESHRLLCEHMRPSVFVQVDDPLCRRCLGSLGVARIPAFERAG